MKYSFYKDIIPKELRKYLDDSTELTIPYEADANSIEKSMSNFKDSLESAKFYNKIPDKIIYYDGTLIRQINYYLHNMRCKKEEYNNDRLYICTYYDDRGFISEQFEYNYDRFNKIVAIKKRKDNCNYLIEYGYDELDRTNHRKIYIDSTLVIEQHYKFDILDRISEYRDMYQKISVQNLGPHNELLLYSITIPKNIITIQNHFSSDKYKETVINVNGHSSQIIDFEYTDNILLKKPLANDSDVSLMLSLFTKPIPTQKTSCDYINDLLNTTFANQMNKKLALKLLPISMRKKMLFFEQKESSA